MNRFAGPLVLALSFACAACKTSGESPPQTAATRDFAGEQKIRFRSEPESPGSESSGPFGVLFSPVNAVLGLLTGAVEGLAVSPGLVGPEDNFGHAMGQPVRNPTTIWWYKK
jgi:hypothetical protein